MKSIKEVDFPSQRVGFFYLTQTAALANSHLKHTFTWAKIAWLSNFNSLCVSFIVHSKLTYNQLKSPLTVLKINIKTDEKHMQSNCWTQEKLRNLTCKIKLVFFPFSMMGSVCTVLETYAVYIYKTFMAYTDIFFRIALMWLQGLSAIFSEYKK